MPAPRRSFLKTSAAAGTAAALTAAAAPAAKLRATHADEIKVGVIGCGGRGCGAVGDAINAARESETAPVKLVAAADLFAEVFDSQKFKALAGQFPDEATLPDESKFSGFDAYKKVFEQDLDYVIIATPPGFRPIHFEAAVEKGCDIFCEKPVATDAPGVRRFLKAVEKSKAKKLKVGVGLQRHHQKSYLEVAEKIADGAIGDLVAMQVYWNSGGVWDPRKTREQTSSELSTNSPIGTTIRGSAAIKSSSSTSTTSMSATGGPALKRAATPPGRRSSRSSAAALGAGRCGPTLSTATSTTTPPASTSMRTARR